MYLELSGLFVLRRRRSGGFPGGFVKWIRFYHNGRDGQCRGTGRAWVTLRINYTSFPIEKNLKTINVWCSTNVKITKNIIFVTGKVLDVVSSRAIWRCILFWFSSKSWVNRDLQYRLFKSLWTIITGQLLTRSIIKMINDYFNKRLN